MNREKWYPLTYPGYYTASLKEMPSLCCEHCRLDLTRFRGEEIGICAASGEKGSVCTLTDEKGNVLEQWEMVPETLLVPQNARYLYLNNHYGKNPDFYIQIPSRLDRKANYLLFDENFCAPELLDGNDFMGDSPAGACTSEGLILPLGIENAIVLQKSTALDDWCMTAEIFAPEGDEAVCLGSRITQGRPCKHASLCCVDLKAKKLFLYRASSGKEMPEEVMQSADLEGILQKGDFILRLEKINLAVRATVIHSATGESVSVTQPITKVETETSVAGGCKAGKIFDSPQIFALSGAPFVRRLYGAAKSSPKVIFFGDSLTQGAHNLPENGWAQMCAADIGDSICCGRGSGDIWSCINQVRTLVPRLRPKAMVVTIGGNNRSDTVSLDTVKGLYEKFIHIADAFGVILILNCTTSGQPHIGETNRILRSLPTLKSRLDLALVENHVEGGERNMDYFVADHRHLNGEGNKIFYRRFMQDFSWLRNL